MMNFRLRYVPFNPEVHGQVYGATMYTREIPTIYIDSLLTEAEQQQALRHELAHLLLDHFADPEKDITQIESEAETVAASLTDADVSKLLQWAVVEC